MLARLSLVVLLASVTAACGAPGDIEAPIDRCEDPACFPTTTSPGALTVENRTGAPIEINLRTPSLTVVSSVFDGTLTVPFPDALLGPESATSLAPDGTTTLGKTMLVPGRAAPQVVGGVIRLAGDPPLLAVGLGKVIIRIGDDGRPFLEADDPKNVSMVRVDRELPACTPGLLDAPFEDAPGFLFDAYATMNEPVVRSVKIDEHGCHVFNIGTLIGNEHLGAVRACIPDDVYPFADDVIVHVSANGPSGPGSSLLFSDERGSYLTLARVGFMDRTAKLAFPEVELAFAEQPTCARVSTACSDVDVPASVIAKTTTGVAQRVELGVPLSGSDANRTTIVLGAAGHPVRNLECGANREMERASAWLVDVLKAK